MASVRKEEALWIDPETAEVFWEHGQVLDPYDVYHLTDEEYCIGRNYFARSPGSIWVSFHDLPGAVRDRLWARMKAGDFDIRNDEAAFVLTSLPAAQIPGLASGSSPIRSNQA